MPQAATESMGNPILSPVVRKGFATAATSG
jgi:hypothetical protein